MDESLEPDFAVNEMKSMRSIIGKSIFFTIAEKASLKSNLIS